MRPRSRNITVDEAVGLEMMTLRAEAEAAHARADEAEQKVDELSAILDETTQRAEVAEAQLVDAGLAALSAALFPAPAELTSKDE